MAFVYGDSSAETAEELLDALLQGIEFDAPTPEVDLGENYTSTVVEVTMGDTALCSARRWWFVGLLAPGAHADLDGRGLALWGASQPGGWRCLDQDGDAYGLADLIQAVQGALLALPVVATDGDDGQEWLDAVTRERVEREIDRWAIPRPSKPTASEIARHLGVGRDAAPWASGTVCGAPSIAWVNGDISVAVHPDTGDIRRAAREVGERSAADAEREITRALASAAEEE